MGEKKQFMEIHGEPLLKITIERFLHARVIREVVVALPPEEMKRGEAILKGFERSGLAFKLVEGGGTRQDSVRAALSEVDRSAVMILVHDAARPLVNAELIERVIDETSRKGAVVPGLPPCDTIKEIAGGQVRVTLDRGSLLAVQTPQGFRAAILRDAYRKAWETGVKATDDSTLVERAGYPVWVIPGDEKNIKLTHRTDMLLIESLLKEGV